MFLRHYDGKETRKEEQWTKGRKEEQFNVNVSMASSTFMRAIWVVIFLNTALRLDCSLRPWRHNRRDNNNCSVPIQFFAKQRAWPVKFKWCFTKSLSPVGLPGL